MKKTFGKNRKHLSEDMALQITSMADIFTIILVFLLKSYSTGVINITPSKGMSLPVAHANDAVVEAVKVELSSTSVQIDGVPAVSLNAFKFDQADLNPNGTAKALSEAFSKTRQRQMLIAKSNTDVKVDPKIIVVADQRAPYQSIKTVLASAAVNGFTDFKLAVVSADQ